MLGPRRYGELLDSLPGIGTNLLATRLEAMRTEGVCARHGRLYSLTDRGRLLEDAVVALARFGMSPMAPPHADDELRPDWYAIAMLAAHNPRRRGPARREAYEFAVDGQTFHLTVDAAGARARRGAATAPAFRLESDLVTFLRVATGAAPATAASVTGDAAAVERWLESFSLPQATG